METKTNQQSVVMLGASGAVGSETVSSFLELNNLQKLTLLGRRSIPHLNADYIHQYTIDISDTHTYHNYIRGHKTAICTLGIGEPSKVSKQEFIKVDKTAVLDFAHICKKEGVQHFQLLSSVGISATSKSFYLRIKGELVEELKALNFERLSIFQPSMILTPTNRYGLSQAIVLKVWPVLEPLLVGGARKYRGVKVSTLGEAIAKNTYTMSEGYEVFQWDDFETLKNAPIL